MSEDLCFLLTLLQPAVGIFGPGVLRVAVKIHRDDRVAFETNMAAFLPLHCRAYPVLEVQEIFEIEVVPRQRTDS